jgi:hypothetical protein
MNRMTYSPSTPSIFAISVSATSQLLFVVGDVLGNDVEGADVGLLEGHRARAGETHRQHGEAVLRHGYSPLLAATFVLVLNGRKIALIEVARAFQFVVCAQHFHMLLVQRRGHHARIGHQLRAVEHDQLLYLWNIVHAHNRGVDQGAHADRDPVGATPEWRWH